MKCVEKGFELAKCFSRSEWEQRMMKWRRNRSLRCTEYEVYKIIWKVDKRVDCNRLRWTTLDMVDYSKMKKEKHEVPTVVRLLDTNSFSSIARLVSSLRRSILLNRSCIVESGYSRGFISEHRRQILKKCFIAVKMSYHSVKFSCSASILVLELPYDDEQFLRVGRDSCWIQ